MPENHLVADIPQKAIIEHDTIECIARAVIIHEGAMLLCKPIADDYFFFPGGHVEFDEDSIVALKREIKEEVDGTITDTRFIGILENQFSQAGETKHEMNIVFEAKLGSSDIENMEDHIESRWVPLAEFKEGRVLPVLLKEKVLQWMQDRQVFFGSEKDNAQFV